MDSDEERRKAEWKMICISVCLRATTGIKFPERDFVGEGNQTSWNQN